MLAGPSSDGIYNEAHKSLRYLLTMSLRNDREQWQTGKCYEMEKTLAIGNSNNLYRIYGNTGPRRSSPSNVIKESNSTLIHSQQRQLACWVKYSREQFSLSTAIVSLPRMLASDPMQGDTNLQSEMTGVREICFFTTYKAAGPEELSQSFLT